MAKDWVDKTDALSNTRWALEQANFEIVTLGALCDQRDEALSLAVADLQGGEKLKQEYLRLAAEKLRKNPRPPKPYSYIQQGYSHIPPQFFEEMNVEEAMKQHDPYLQDAVADVQFGLETHKSRRFDHKAAIKGGAFIGIIVWLVWLAL